MATNIPKLTYSVPEVCEALQISRTTLTGLKFEDITPSEFKEKAGGLDNP